MYNSTGEFSKICDKKIKLFTPAREDKPILYIIYNVPGGSRGVVLDGLVIDVCRVSTQGETLTATGFLSPRVAIRGRDVVRRGSLPSAAALSNISESG